MIYFNGFCLKDDIKFFKPFIQESEFYVYGFSYGAIKAFLHVKELLENFKRVDKLVLFSPAFFQTKADKFKLLQLKNFEKNQQRYVDNFIDNCFLPYKRCDIILNNDTKEDLEKLLHFEWKIDELYKIKQKGVKIEVYLGGKDRIIDVDGAMEFFKEVADITYIKDANHFLKVGE